LCRPSFYMAGFEVATYGRFWGAIQVFLTFDKDNTGRFVWPVHRA